jgi:hypothetical protein
VCFLYKDQSQALLAKDRQALRDDRATMMLRVDEKLARGEAEVEEKRAAVERDRVELDDDKARMREAAPLLGGVVKLNVGGARFETSRGVLTKVEDSMLGRMFGRCDAMLQCDPDDGSIFIDRDGERFRVILDFLRDLDGPHTQKSIGKLSEAAQEAMVKELDYFGLETAVFGARLWTDLAAFRPGPAMGSARSDCASVSAGGRIVVFGGDSGATPLNTTLLLDAQTMAFTAGPNMLARRDGCAAVQIDADRVLVVGGMNEDDETLNTTEIFHLATLTFTPGPDLQSARSYCAAVALDARRILVVCGFDGTSRLSTTEIFSLDTMTFAPGPTTTAPREGCAAVALDEHRIMVAGGYSGSEDLNTTEVLDIRTMAFAPGPSMGSVRCHCAAVQVDAQHVLIIGGGDSSIVATTELLDVATMEFSPGPTMQAARASCAAARLDTAQGPRILVLGGRHRGVYLSTTEVLEVSAEERRAAPRRRQ